MEGSARLERLLVKLRGNYGHALDLQMMKALSRMPDFNTETIIQGGKTAKSRRTCVIVATRPPFPRAGNRGAIHFGGIAKLDLFFAEDLIALTYVDVATRLARYSEI